MTSSSTVRFVVVALVGASILVALLFFQFIQHRRSVVSALREPSSGRDDADLVSPELGMAAREELGGSISISVTVLDDRDQPVVGARLELLALDDGARRTARTDRTGQAGVPPGAYAVWIHGDGFVDAFGPCEIEEERTLRVERGASVTLAFTDAGVPRPGMRARLRAEPREGTAPSLAGVEREMLRKACFAPGRAGAQAAALAQPLVGVAFGSTHVSALSEERTSDADGRCTWSGVPPGTYRWQRLSDERVAFDPPQEVGRFTEDEQGRLELTEGPRDLSGAFELAPGAALTLEARILKGARVHGVVVAEGGRPVEGARVTLREVARASRSPNTASVPVAYARTGAHGTFVFAAVSPGEKEVFAILDETEQRRFWISERMAKFELAEGEEHDVGVLSMDGATVEISARLVDEEGRALAFEEVVADPKPWATLVLSNGIRDGSGFSTTLWMRLGEGESTTVHGLTPMASATLSGCNAEPRESSIWTLRPGFRESFGESTRNRFDPYAEPRVVLDIPIQRVLACALLFRIPPGAPHPEFGSLQGKALRLADRRSTSVRLELIEGGYGGELELPPGTQELRAWTTLPPGHPTFFARARIEVPCSGPLEFPLERAVRVSGVLVDAQGRPLRDRGVRAGTSDLQEVDWWTAAWTDDAGRFELCGVPPDSTLVFENAPEPVHVGASDRTDVTVEVNAP